MSPAPAKMTQGAAALLTTVAPITTTSTPVRRTRGHQRVRRVCTSRAPLRRAGLPAGTAGRPSAPGTAGTAGLSVSRRCDRRIISPVQQLFTAATSPNLGGCAPSAYPPWPRHCCTPASCGGSYHTARHPGMRSSDGPRIERPSEPRMIPARPGKAQDSSWGQPRGGAQGRRPRPGAITCLPGGRAGLARLGDVRMVSAWPGSRQCCRATAAGLLAPRVWPASPPPVSPAAVARAAARTTQAGARDGAGSGSLAGCSTPIPPGTRTVREPGGRSGRRRGPARDPAARARHP